MKLLYAALLSLHLAAFSSANAAPAMFWFNDPVGPDETVLVTGADLDRVTAASVSRVSDGAESTTVQEVAVDILQANPLSLKFVIPKEFVPGIYRFTLSYPQGQLTGHANLPTVYWSQSRFGDSAAPGDSVHVFGRNVVRQPGRAQLVLQPDGGGAPTSTTLTKGDLWRGSFRIPDRTSPGRYQLRLTNGDGGAAEWVDAGSLTIRSLAPDSERSFDVRAYGANGDGKTDSTRAIKSTIEAAAQEGGGTVYLPRGRYLVTDTLVLPPQVRLRGERTDLVNLVWPDFASPPSALIQGTSRFSIEDLTIYASNHFHVISGGFIFRDGQVPDAGDIAIRRVRIRASAFRGHIDAEATARRMSDSKRIFPTGAPDTIRLTGSRIEVSDCDVLGSGHSLFLFKANDAIVSGNILNNGRSGSYFLSGSRQVIFENNQITGADLQATGGGISMTSSSIVSSENIYIAGNTFKSFHGWDREAVTSDAPGGYYFGHADSPSPRVLSLRDAPNPYPPSQNWSGAMVMVVNGRGAGQYARIASTSGIAPALSIALDRPLQVPLDRTSEITVVQAQQNYLIVDNFFEDTGVGAQAFGTALGHVIAGNRSNRTSGFAAVGLDYGHFQPCWRIQFLDNQILEGNVYRAGPDENVISNEAMIFVRANQSAVGAGKPPLVQAVIVRGNRLEQDAHIQVQGFSTASPGIRDVVIEANTTGPSRVGTLVDRGVAHWLGRRNTEARRIGR